MADETPRQVFRLTQDQYERLEKQVPQPIVGQTTTDLQAGFQLGIQHVLKILRSGYVIGT